MGVFLRIMLRYGLYAPKVLKELKKHVKKSVPTV